MVWGVGPGTVCSTNASVGREAAGMCVSIPFKLGACRGVAAQQIQQQRRLQARRRAGPAAAAAVRDGHQEVAHGKRRQAACRACVRVCGRCGRRALAVAGAVAWAAGCRTDAPCKPPPRTPKLSVPPMPLKA
eukprot:64365-Chlamydomonas_euryale.AAC.3